MATRTRLVDLGTARGRELRLRAGRELREARTDRALSLAVVAHAVGLSVSQVSRIERGLVERVSVHDLARLHAVVGLELSVRSYPGGQPIRDAPQVALLGEFRALLHRSLGWAGEVPLPVVGDRRSWDGVVRGPDWVYGVEAETAPTDSQAVARRLQLKLRDGGLDGVLLVVRATAQTRRFLAEAGELLRASFPVDGARAVELLRAGVDPGGSAIIVLPAPRRTARRGDGVRRRPGPVCRGSNNG